MRSPRHQHLEIILIAAAGACMITASACHEPLPRSSSEAPAEFVDLANLLQEMIDLDHLARFPDPPYRHRLASSTDPSATTPADPATWFKNEDLDHYRTMETRKDRTEYVLLDTQGPGAILRIWSANPTGTLRIYIDDMETPAIEADMKALLTGQIAPFAPPFAYEAARGANLYFPFPYQSGAKVTMDARGAFYQVNYRSYPEGTKVESFDRSDLARNRVLVQHVARTLSDPPSLLADSEKLRATTFTRKISIAGPGVVRELRIDAPAAGAQQLRALVLVVRADGRETVRVPLGDFFGSGPGRTPFQSLVAEVTKDGTLIARWPMPFRFSLEVEIEGAEEGDFRGQILTGAWTWDERSLYFQAAWREERPGLSWPPRDWSLVSIRGRGVYAGTLLEVSNSTKAWWGEGDEKIRVDEEAFPSHFGTGTEDYFGYAWSTPRTFHRPYHSQTIAEGPGGYGAFSMHRWHILDPIPFTRSLAFDQEIWHWSRSATIGLAAVSYFYADSGAQTNGLPVATGQAGLYRPKDLPQKALKGALEGETLSLESTTGGRVRKESMVRYLGGLWSSDQQLRWQNPSEGDSLTLAFSPPEAGRFRVLANLTRGREYGLFALGVNAPKQAQRVDLGFPIVGNLDHVDLGVHDLPASPSTLRVLSLGPSHRGTGRDFGLDCLLLEPEP